ncbi:hypothetical protein M0812_17044 [Anaeramoeba flamelloides]|uniref:Transmembrane protein n=1 Tax=Anaeramoeba flamelloides TaxID=1746091 RepID=A0AAV7Z9W0_9EUKA|nr:hypothetical protein M0812_17044 [Anaeramoeba flamelloides]
MNFLLNKIIFIAFLILVVSASDCSKYKTQSNCNSSGDQCKCVWYQCMKSNKVDEDNGWCLEGDSNGVSSKISKDDYSCPTSDDTARYTYKCKGKISGIGITLIILISICFLILVSILILILRKKKENDTKYQKL